MFELLIVKHIKLTHQAFHCQSFINFFLNFSQNFHVFCSWIYFIFIAFSQANRFFFSLMIAHYHHRLYLIWIFSSKLINLHIWLLTHRVLISLLHETSLYKQISSLSILLHHIKHLIAYTQLIIEKISLVFSVGSEGGLCSMIMMS